MAPPPPPPLDLIDDATAEILFRFPPDDPACLVRASLVCKAWRELLSSPAFLRRYRAFQGAPPLLGFLHNIYDEGPCARFVAATTTTTFPFSGPAFDRFGWWFVECRHGRALLQTFERHAPARLAVWDPITGDQQYLPMPVFGHPYFCRSAAVLCAADGCDRLDCHGGPFLVVVLGAYEEDTHIWASVYSSETGVWTISFSIQLDAYIEERPSLLAGDALYFTDQQGKMILEYDFIGHSLHVINAPDMFEPMEDIVMTVDVGGLGLALSEEWQSPPVVMEGWSSRHSGMGARQVMLRSEQVKKVGKTGSKYAMAPYVSSPYVSFYTPGITLKHSFSRIVEISATGLILSEDGSYTW